VCNIGGSLPACYEADLRVIASLEELRTSLETATVPPRFEAANLLLLDAVSESIKGLELRNEAIETVDLTAWEQHHEVIASAVSMFDHAYAAFPDDSRPHPRP
jgi:hypothetical protein